MRILLDTNIVIHREASTVVNSSIGILFRWLDKLKFDKCVHPVTLAEIKHPTLFPDPIDLKQHFGLSRPPQSFCYV
jgi:predicted nucleic acid-binding protein